MAENDEEETAVEPAKKGGGKGVIIVALVCLIIGAIGGFFGAGVVNGGSPGGGAEPDGQTTITNLGEFTVNLRNSAGGRVLQMNLSVETNVDLSLKITERTAEIRDSILMLASNYTIAQLDGMDNRKDFQDAIETRVDTILGEDQVERIYFTNFVVE
jgi:flagellar basal body-associated protein FliL